MKKAFILFIAFFTAIVLSSCHWHNEHHNTSITYSDHGRYYKMKARFDRDKMRRLERYMDRKLDAGMSFQNTRLDGELTLDDRCTFYIKKSPGYLYIMIDKDRISHRSFYKLRAMCQGIKEVLVN